MATTTRFYLTPKTGTGVAGDAYRPEHFVDGIGLTWIVGGLTCQDYGQEPTFFVTAAITDEEHAQVITQPGVEEVPGPPALDAPLGVRAAPLAARLEAAGMPGRWVRPLTTSRSVLRHIQRCVALAQRLQPYGRIFPPGRTLDSRVHDLTPAQRQLLLTAADQPPDVLQGAWTLRRALTVLTAPLLPGPLRLFDVEL